ncbi:MAG TPA: SAF domain-containing protein [Candidatus Limnocylindrales bacterium]|nr:SAF domain-containing protein [Candidatus Limnocylindrales bacterium]
MEMEYRDNSRRGKLIIALGVILALVAGATSFFLLNQASQSAGQGALQKLTVVVAAKNIQSHIPVVAGDVALREVALDPTTQTGIVTKVDDVVGKVLAVPVLTGQPIYKTFIASSSGGSGFSILGPTETVGPGSEAWRAVSITIPDDRAVAGLLEVGQTIDVIMTATVNVPAPYASSGFYADFATKVTYQDVVILARVENQYIIRCSLAVAEEISHFQATGAAQFSAALRPDQDIRYADVAKLGATTSRILEKYGLPWPVVYPAASGPIPPQPPLQTPTPPPSLEPIDPAPS